MTTTSNALHAPIQASMLDRCGDMCGLKLFGAREIRDGAADFEDTAIGAGR